MVRIKGDTDGVAVKQAGGASMQGFGACFLASNHVMHVSWERMLNVFADGEAVKQVGGASVMPTSITD